MKLIWEQEAAGSNPAIPTGNRCFSNWLANFDARWELVGERRPVMSGVAGRRWMIGSPAVRASIFLFDSDSVSICGFCHLEWSLLGPPGWLLDCLIWPPARAAVSSHRRAGQRSRGGSPVMEDLLHIGARALRRATPQDALHDGLGPHGHAVGT